MDNFWINGKPIALLFGEKWSFINSSCKLENVENGQFLDKWQAYSLTFW